MNMIVALTVFFVLHFGKFLVEQNAAKDELIKRLLAGHQAAGGAATPCEAAALALCQSIAGPILCANGSSSALVEQAAQAWEF